MDLRNMITQVRLKLKDTRVRVFQQPEIIFALNEGKDELVKIIREANESFFETTVTGTISSTTTPNASIVTLPADFAQLRDIKITTAGYQDTVFQRLNHSDPRFQNSLLDGGSFANGMGVFFYDFQGLSTMLLAPGSDIDLAYSLDYIKTVTDMVLPTDTPTEIPAEHHGFIVTWGICECMRMVEDDRLDQYESKLEFQRNSVIAGVNTRQAKEPTFVTGFMEEEYWG